MTTYELPREPQTDRVWVNLPTGWIEARRRGPNDWTATVNGRVSEHTWADLLGAGGITDVHPDLPPHHPLPWKIDDWDSVADATGHGIDLSGNDRALSEFVVAAVNTHAARITDPPEQRPAVDTLGHAVELVREVWAAMPESKAAFDGSYAWCRADLHRTLPGLAKALDTLADATRKEPTS